MDGQSVVLEDYLEVRPEKRELVEKYVKEGRITAGTWYTLPDLYPLDSECLVRNLLKGFRTSEGFGEEYEKGFFDKACEYMLKCHAHDSINGVTQDSTAEDVMSNLRQARGNFFTGYLIWNDETIRTLPVQVYIMKNDPDIKLNTYMMSLVLTTVPLFVLFAVFNKQIVTGVNISGVKG